MIEVRFLTVHNSQATGPRIQVPCLFHLSSSPLFFHCTTLSLKPSKHLPLTTFNQHVTFLQKHCICSFIQFQFSIKLSSLPGSCIIVSVISALGDSVIHINQKYKNDFRLIYINNSVHSCSWFLLGGSFLRSVILFEVWWVGERRQISLYWTLAFRASGETDIIWMEIILSTANTIG